ncbi:uncharacterized protein LOC111712836 [Eurytemora carolleeae]|uniref:uncharacterized protein LOC111712836 n=1 Tax=Eurytemora carolleeae TaxID=1294199 RepID=UPI000C768AB9|nr:uncharacterized protein LOC111712836 [Eurytemora carolleeae]|eukprot:XP_023343342.1 uncharacterized protein LOC111712836 [Eurytemora affinis]
MMSGRSSVSGVSGNQSSSSVAGMSVQINLDDMAIEQIIALVAESSQSVNRLSQETSMLEEFYNRMTGGEVIATVFERAESQEGSSAASPESSKPATASGSVLDTGVNVNPSIRRSVAGRRHSSGSRIDPRGRQIRLSIIQKCGIAGKEVSLTQQNKAKEILSRRIQLEQGRANLEERTMQLKESFKLTFI